MRYWIVGVFILISVAGKAQAEREISFIQHLVNKGMYKEAIFLIEREAKNYHSQQRDSLNYFKGWACYSLKRLPESTQAFLQVGEASPFYHKSYFFASYNQAFLGNYDKAQNILQQLPLHNEPELSLRKFEFSGIEMLRGNWQQGAELLLQVDGENAAVSQQVHALNEIWNEHTTHKPKSPALAGILSALLPGTGKIYAGKTGSGIAAMLGTVSFGLITWENYRKSGIADAKTIIFGSIFAVNYVSNIYGSVVSVKIIEQEHENNVHNQILFQLHIPLRNFFD